MDVDQEGGQLTLRAIHLVKHIAIIAVAIGIGGARDLFLKQAIRQQTIGAQLGRVKAAAYLGKGCLIGLQIFCFRRIAKIIPFAIIGIDNAPVGLGERGARKFCCVIIGKKFGEGGILHIDRCRNLRRSGHRRGGSQKRRCGRGRQQKGKDGMAHK